MGAASLAQNFGALHTQASVLLKNNTLVRGRLEKAGPARAGIKLGSGCKKVLRTTHALVRTFFIKVIILS